MELSQRPGKMPNLPRSILAPGSTHDDEWKEASSIADLSGLLLLCYQLLSLE